MTTKIEIRHVCREMMRDNSWEHTDTLVGSFSMTSRGLAAATREMDSDKAYYRRLFGPGTISPSHGTYARLVYADGSTHAVDLDFYRPEPGCHWARWATWTAAAKALAKEAESLAENADPADLHA